MEYIKSKNICYLIADTLRIIDKRLMEHGQKTAYILYQMLQCRGGFEQYELAEYAFLGFLHDIGAYKTDHIGKLLRFQISDYMPHSIYGYLFLKYLSPMKERARILLYHHTDYSRMQSIDYEYKDIADFLHLADTVEIFYRRLKDKFDCCYFEKYVGTRFSKEAVRLLVMAEEQNQILEKISDGRYEQEMDDLMNSIIFTNEEKRKYLEMLMYCSGLRYEQLVVDAVTSICISEELGKKLKLESTQYEILYYAALLHDIGMLAIPGSILDAKRALTKEEVKVVRSHVEIEEQRLLDAMSESVLEVISAHHERADGSGYPRHLKDSQMNILQRVLQLSDVVTALANDRSYHPIRTGEEIRAILQSEMEHNRLNKKIVQVFLKNFDDIWKEVEVRRGEILEMHTRLHTQYKKISAKIAHRNQQAALQDQMLTK